MIKQWFQRVFPPALVDFVPGKKIVAGFVAFVVLQLAQLVGGDLTVFGLGENEVQGLSALIIAYLWPTDNAPPVVLDDIARATQTAVTGNYVPPARVRK